jgi:peptidoglycan hydrolase-like protein with peptidoglycan-binding domain
MNRCILALLVLLLAGGVVLGNEQIRRVQEELRKRNVYFGEVDGRKTDETERAIRRYQQRQGFPQTGAADESTLRSLNIALGPVKPEEDWPEGSVVMKGDSAREISAADKKALEQWNSVDPPPVLEAEKTAEGQKPEASAEVAPAVKEPPIDSTKLAPPKTAESKAPPEPVKPAATPKAPPPIADLDRSARPRPAPTDFAPTSDPQTFVRRYLEACEGNHLGAELSFYAPRVTYFDHGSVSRDFVAKDVQRFYERWPQRKYELLSCEQTPLPGGEHQVVFKIAFHYENPERNQKVSGRSVNVFRMREFETGPRFTSLKEQRLRN